MGAVIKFDVNNRQVVQFANELEKMRRSDFPVSVRSTLNNMAFDVKKNTLLRSARKKFTIRNKTFFKKFSSVKKAIGFEVDSMKSEVGISPGQNIAAKGLKKQELGGKLDKRSFIYMDTARVSGMGNKRVAQRNIINKKSKLSGSPNRRRTAKSQFVADAFMAKKKNKFMIQKSKSGKTAFSVKNIKTSGGGSGRKVFAKTTAIADYQKGRSVNVKARPFLKPASLISARKGVDFFIKEYEKRIKRYELAR